MKTAQIIRRFSFREWGGTESVVWNSSRQLAAAGDKVEILATQALDRNPETDRESIVIRRFPYSYPYWPLSADRRAALDKKGGNPLTPELFRYIAQNDFELLHCHNLGRLAQMTALTAAARQIPYVLSFHGGCLDVPPAEMQEMLKPLRHTLPYGKILDRLAGRGFDPLGRAAGLLCVGRNELELLRKKYPDRRIEYFPNGVDVGHFVRPARLDFRARYRIPADRKLILAVSRIDYQKNQAALLDVLAELNGKTPLPQCWHLALVGPATAGWYLELLKARIAELKLNEFVTIVPGLPPDAPELPAAYQAADVFALASRHEPFGIVILEAWAARLPVVAAPVGGVPYLIQDGQTGMLCDPAHTQDFAGALQRAEQERARLTSQAFEVVQSDYDWPRIAGKLQTFYREILQRPNR